MLKQSSLKLSKLKKGDKILISHDDKKLTIIITHIEMEKGTPCVNFSYSGDEDIQLSSEIKVKKEMKRTRKLEGSNKGHGWTKGSCSIKK